MKTEFKEQAECPKKLFDLLFGPSLIPNINWENNHLAPPLKNCLKHALGFLLAMQEILAPKLGLEVPVPGSLILNPPWG